MVYCQRTLAATGYLKVTVLSILLSVLRIKPALNSQLFLQWYSSRHSNYWDSLLALCWVFRYFFTVVIQLSILLSSTANINFILSFELLSCLHCYLTSQYFSKIFFKYMFWLPTLKIWLIESVCINIITLIKLLDCCFNSILSS